MARGVHSNVAGQQSGGKTVLPPQRLGILAIVGGYRHINGQVLVPMMYLLNSRLNFAPQLCQNTMLAGVPEDRQIRYRVREASPGIIVSN